MPDLVDYDPANPPLAKLHVITQLDRDLARFKTGRTRLAWKHFPIRDRKTNEEIARIEFTSDGGIAFTFAIATAKERSWAISAQALFDCVDAADKLYVNAQTPMAKAQVKAQQMRAKSRVPNARRVTAAKRKARR